MANEQTINYLLKKTEGTENAFFHILTEGNDNLDKIDEIIKIQETTLKNHMGSIIAHNSDNLTYTGKLGSQSITYAIDKVQDNLGEYINFSNNQYMGMINSEIDRKESENDRKMKDMIRESNEANRINIFNANEINRTKTFSVSELARQSTMAQFQNWYNTSNLTGKLPIFIDGGDYGDIDTGKTYNGGDY